MGESIQKDVLVQSLVNFEYQPVFSDEIEAVDKGTKIPFTKIAAYGGGLSSILPAFRTVTQTSTRIMSPGTPGKLYKVKFPENAQGTLVQKGGITLGNMVGADGHTFSARARFVETNIGPSTVSNTTSTIMPINPAMVFMAAALDSIDRKLDKIVEIQTDILDFLTKNKESVLKGNLIFLSDVLNNYKFNWNNNTYINSMYVKVQDIKQESIQNINFYRTQIKSKEKTFDKLIIGDNDVKSLLEKLLPDFYNYQISVYTYGFSSFLEVMLLKNFDRNYLNSIIKTSEDYYVQYLDLYTKCYNMLESSANSSIQKHFFNALASVSKTTGEAIAKIPLISKSQIDETLIDSGERMDKRNKKRAQVMLKKLTENRDNSIGPFIQNLQTIDKLYNEPVNLFFDTENLYIASSIKSPSTII